VILGFYEEKIWGFGGVRGWFVFGVFVFFFVFLCFGGFLVFFFFVWCVGCFWLGGCESFVVVDLGFWYFVYVFCFV